MTRVIDDAFNVMAGGFDGGVRLGEIIAHDVIALPLMACSGRCL